MRVSPPFGATIERVGLTFDKILVILVIAMFVLGPDRLPIYAKKLGELVRSVKRMSEGAKDRLKEEMGPEYDEVDWRQLDPRQYDPRRIIRDALLEDERETRIAERATDQPAARAPALSPESVSPEPTAQLTFDEEAT